MNKIKEFIFGRKQESVCTISTKLHTVAPGTRISFENWCKEFRVSIMWDKRVVHIE